MAVFHQDEQSFWKTANPARLWSIFDAWLRPEGRNDDTGSLQNGEKQPRMGLSEYLMRGGN